MSRPAWIADLTEELGTRRRSGEVSRQEAVTSLRDTIAEKGDQLLFLAIFGEFAGRVLDSWDREHRHAPLPGAQAGLQMELFPDLAPRLFIRPGVTKPVMALNAHDWDNAREVLLNRTKHAIEGAEADRARFEKAYEAVRPLLSGDNTTADVAAEIIRQRRGENPLEGLA